MADHFYRKGDTYPPLRFEEEAWSEGHLASTPFDLTDCSVSCEYKRKRDGKHISRRLRVLVASEGLVSPPPTNGPFDTPMEIWLHFPNDFVRLVGQVQVVRELV